MLRNQRLQLAGQLPVHTPAEFGFDAILERSDAELLETRDRRLRERLVGEIGERRTPPQGKPLSQSRRGGVCAPLSEGKTALLRQALEPIEVQLIRLELDQIARRPSQNELRQACPFRACGERTAKIGHEDLEGVGSGLRRPLAPEL